MIKKRDLKQFEDYVIASWIPLFSNNPSAPKALITKHFEIPLSGHPSTRCLSEYYRYSQAELNKARICLKLETRHPEILSPIEIYIKAEKLTTQYVYHLTLSMYEEEIYHEEYKCDLPWDFLNIRSDHKYQHWFLDHIDHLQYPIVLRLKNERLWFSDVEGNGVFADLTHVVKDFWVHDEIELREADLVSNWYDFEKELIVTLEEFKIKIHATFNSGILLINNIRQRFEKSLDEFFATRKSVDLAFLKVKLIELDYLYDRLLAKGVKALIEKSPKEANQSINYLQNFFTEVKSIIEQNCGEKETVSHLPNFELTVEASAALQGVILQLFSNENSYQKLIEDNKDIHDKILGHFYENVKKARPKYEEFGLLWRWDSGIFDYLNRCILKSIIESKNSPVKTFSLVKEDCSRETCDESENIFCTVVFGWKVWINNQGLFWKKINNSSQPNHTPLTLHTTGSVQVLDYVVYMKVLVSTFDEMKTALCRMDLLSLKTHDELKVEYIRTVGMYGKIRSTVSHKMLVIMLPREPGIGLEIYDIANINKEAKLARSFTLKSVLGKDELHGRDDCISLDSPGKLEFRAYGMRLFVQFLSNTKDGKKRRLVFYIKVDAEWEPNLADRLEDFHPAALLSSGDDFKETHFFKTKGVPFILLISEKLNYHLTTLVGEKLKVVKSWEGRKGVFNAWRFEKESRVNVLWDRTHERLCLCKTRPKSLSVLNIRLAF